MPIYNIGEAKARLSELVNKALAGEDVIVARDNKPLLKLERIDAPSKRVPGSARGLIRMAADFDETPADFGDYTFPL